MHVMKSLEDRIRQTINHLDEPGESGFTLAKSVGAHISSYTGPHGWYRGTNSENPPLEPVYQQVFRMMRSNYIDFLLEQRRGVDLEVEAAEEQFAKDPTFETLRAYGAAVEKLGARAL
jgi:hypothetical protein